MPIITAIPRALPRARRNGIVDLSHSLPSSPAARPPIVWKIATDTAFLPRAENISREIISRGEKSEDKKTCSESAEASRRRVGARARIRDYNPGIARGRIYDLVSHKE